MDIASDTRIKHAPTANEISASTTCRWLLPAYANALRTECNQRAGREMPGSLSEEAPIPIGNGIAVSIRQTVPPNAETQFVGESCSTSNMLIRRGVTAALASFALYVVAKSPCEAQQQLKLPQAAASVAVSPQPAQATLPALPETSPSSSLSATPRPATGLRLDPFRLTAGRVVFYSNRFIVGADDNVVVTLGDGTRISGNTFFEDLRLNRFVIAGNVTVTAGGKQIHGAAFAEYFDFDRAYFIPITSEPDRWTFIAGDYAHPAFGRLMPGDVFFLPDVDGERIFLVANRATIAPHESVRFAPAKINFGLTYVSFPSYFLEFSQNPNYAQNALPGAVVDGPLDFAGGGHGLATAHIRYDSQNNVFAAYEQHQFSDNSYFVAAISPLTRPLKYYNFVGYDRISPGLQVQTFLQETAFQHGFSQPLAASALVQLSITGSLPHSYLQLQLANYYNSLLAEPAPDRYGRRYYGNPSYVWTPDHPVNEQLAWVGFRHQINDLPFSYQLRSAIGYAHNRDTPLQTLGGVAYHSEYTKSVGISLTSKSIPIIRDARRRDLYVTASADKQRLYFSVPHYTDTTTENLTITKLFDPQKLVVLLSYINSNVGDFYGRQQSNVYGSVTAIDPFTGQTFPGFRAFHGFATTRSYAQQLVYTPNPIFNLNVSLRENADFPKPVPGQPLLVGNAVVFQNFGLTPYQATLDVRYRVNRLIVLDISRSYFFNFGGYERWQPQFSVQLEK